jgi:hypothetical protein
MEGMDSDAPISRQEFEHSNRQVWESIKALRDTIKTGAADNSQANVALVETLRNESKQRRTDFDGLMSKIDQLTGDFSKSRETNWGASAAVGAVALTMLLAIVGGFGSGYVRDQTRLDHEIHEQGARNDSAHILLDATLQREMRLLDERGVAERVALDEKLQIEVNGVREILQTEISALEARIDSDDDGVDSAQNERLRALERAAYGVDPPPK